MTKERDSYKIKLENETIDNIMGKKIDEMMDEFEWSISEEELDEANIKLGYANSGSGTCMVQGLTPDKLNKMVMELYFNPSKHIDIISQLMKTIP